MSCGNHHDVSCREVLDRVFEFLDSECDQHSSSEIAQHLEECGPCLQHFGIEREVKALIQRKCGGDAAPAGLHERVRLRLRMVAIEQGYLQQTTVVQDSRVQETAAGRQTTVETTFVQRLSQPFDPSRPPEL